MGELSLDISKLEQDLEVLFDQYNHDDGLSGAGKKQAFDQIVLCIANHILINDKLSKLEPKELNQNHLIVAGLPRSGTTHLLNLLAVDPRFRALPLWVADEPVLAEHSKTAPLSLKLISRLLEHLTGTPEPENPLSHGQDPRYLRCSIQWSVMQLMAPHLAAMHPMNPDHIHEEYGMMGYNLGGSEFEWRTFAPRWRDHYKKADQYRHYQWLKQVLGLLQSENNPDIPWVLKKCSTFGAIARTTQHFSRSDGGIYAS